MAISNRPIAVLMDEQRRIDLFYSFWNRRIDVESNYIIALEGLIFEVPGPAGSLKDAWDALNALMRIEIDQRSATLSVFRDLRDQKVVPSESEDTWSENTSKWFTSAKDDVQKRIVDLAKQKAELTLSEEAAEKATLTKTEEVIQESVDNPSTITRLLFGERKNQRPPSKTPPVAPFTQFDHADRRYRNSVVCYNELRKHHLNESMEEAEKLVTVDFKAINMIQKMINAVIDCQSDLMGALNHGSSQCRFMANNISPSTESNDFLVRVQNGIQAGFGQPRSYKNFWFGVGPNGRLPMILFGRYIPKYDSTDTTVIRICQILVEYCTSSPLMTPQRPTIEDYERLSKLAHDVEVRWDPEMINGGIEVMRLLGTEQTQRCQELLLHFLLRMPTPLLDVLPELFSLVESFSFLCNECNDKSSSYHKRKMLSIVLQFLVHSSKDQEWTWWDQNGRKVLWIRALTHKEHHTFHRYFPLWVRCIEYSGTGECVFLPGKLESSYYSWLQWNGGSRPARTEPEKQFGAR